VALTPILWLALESPSHCGRVTESLPSRCQVIAGSWPSYWCSASATFRSQSSLPFAFTDFLTRHMNILSHTFCLFDLVLYAVDTQILKEQQHTRTPSLCLFWISFTPHLHLPLTHLGHRQFSFLLPLLRDWEAWARQLRQILNEVINTSTTSHLSCSIISSGVCLMVPVCLYCLNKLRMCKCDILA